MGMRHVYRAVGSLAIISLVLSLLVVCLSLVCLFLIRSNPTPQRRASMHPMHNLGAAERRQLGKLQV
jgi:hypothetical protein